jgi:hypothetical protein
MGILSLVRLLVRYVKPADLIVFLISVFIGYYVASFLPEGAWANYTFILLSYHLFLTWLVIDADHETGISLPIVSTLLTHAACLVLIISFGAESHHIPLFVFVRAGVVMLAIFERDWLFSGNAQKKVIKEKKVPVKAALNAIPVHVALAEATAEDHEAWIRYLAQPNRTARKPGLTVKDEYEQWLVARIGSCHAAASSKSPA